MKIRQGFVSNSSSSSFVVIGNSVNIESIKPENLNNNKHITYYATSGCDGESGFGPIMVEIKDNDMLEMLKNPPIETENSIYGYEVYHYIGEGWGSNDKIKKSELPDEFEVISFTCDQYEISSLKELKELYDEYEQ
jgi:hypothetical protein